MPVPLTRAARGKAASPLPVPFPGLADSRFQVQFRLGQLVMLAGPPGAGKSMLALSAALKMGAQGATCLYISADSDEDTMAARAAAVITGHPVNDIMQTIQFGLFREQYGDRLKKFPIRFEYDPTDPTVGDIANALTAWVEVWGTPPSLLVVDNLMNMSGGDTNEWQAMRQAVKDLHFLARKSRMCVLVLHHTSEQDASHIEQAPPRSAIQGKVSQLPSMILTVANYLGVMFVGVVKQRHGVTDPMAKEPVQLQVDFATCQVTDVKNTGGWIAHGQRRA